ncbi:MAG: transcription initiation factor IIB, partial [Thermoprotei archaeon]
MAVGSCPECGGRLIRDRGEVVCSSCGLVLSEERAWGPEWRAFTPEERERRERVGAPINPLIGDALTTEVGWSLGRLRWWHEVVTASSVRLVARGRATVEKVASQLGLPERVKDLAVQYFVRGVRAGVSKGRPARALAAAAVYAACRAHGVPRTLREIARTAGAPRRRAFRCYRLLVEAGVRVPRA